LSWEDEPDGEEYRSNVSLSRAGAKSGHGILESSLQESSVGTTARMDPIPPWDSPPLSFVCFKVTCFQNFDFVFLLQ